MIQTRDDQERTLRMLVDHAVPGARIYFPRKRCWRAGHSWNGKHLRPTGLTLESHCHEVAHLLVAPQERLSAPEFGLGPDPYRRAFVPCIISQQEADLEELFTCSMQLLLVRLLGLDEAAVMLEVKTEALTPKRIDELFLYCPHALPDSWWERAWGVVRQSHCA